MGWPESEERSVVLGKVLTMKKWLALLLLSAFVGSVASAQWVVYDFKASIKRLDDTISTVKYSPNVYDQSSTVPLIFDSYKVYVDSLWGYLLVPICIGCSDDGSDSSLPFGDAFLYLRRKADKTRAIWVLPAEVQAALFAKGVTNRPDEEILGRSPTSLKKLNQVWMQLSFEFGDQGLEAPLGKYGDLPYGFLGHGSATGVLTGTGFGYAKLLSQTTVNFCSPSQDANCFVVSSIKNGRMVSLELVQKGICEDFIPIWDMCSDEEGVMATTELAVAHATWNLKINNTLSTSANNSYYPDDVLINKLGTGEVIYGD